MVVIVVALGFIAFDIVTGVLKGLKEGELNSTVLRNGLFKKFSEILTLVGAYLLEYACNYVDLGIELPLLGAFAVYICGMELLSIMENLAEMNDALAALFAPYLDKLKNKNSTEG